MGFKPSYDLCDCRAVETSPNMTFSFTVCPALRTHDDLFPRSTLGE